MAKIRNLMLKGEENNDVAKIYLLCEVNLKNWEKIVFWTISKRHNIYLNFFCNHLKAILILKNNF